MSTEVTKVVTQSRPGGNPPGERKQSVLFEDLLLLNKRIANQCIAVQRRFVHVHRCDLAVVVGRVVVYAPCGIAAARVKRDFVFAVFELAASALLLNGSQDMKELADAALFRRFAERMGADKRGANKTRLAGQVAPADRARPSRGCKR